MSGAARRGVRDGGERPIEPGAKIGSYRVVRVLATRPGIDSTVAAANLRDGPVTLTLLSEALCADRDARRVVLDRARLRSSIEHPHLVPLRVAGERTARPFLVWRRPGARTLAEWLHAGDLEPRAAVRLLGQVAGALDTAAVRGLQHRDLTPEAILVNRAGDAMDALLTDFGVTLPSLPGCVSPTAVSGAAYRAPEAVRGEEPKSPANVYSLACILVECLTGAPPYSYDRPLLTMHAHVVEPPPRVSERREGLPAAIDDVVAHGLAKDPGARHDTAGDLVREAAKAMGVTAAVPVVKPPRTRRARGGHVTRRSAGAPAGRGGRARALRRRAPALVALALLASAASGFATGSVDWSGAPRPTGTKVTTPAAERAGQEARSDYVRAVGRAVERLDRRRAADRTRLRKATRAAGQAAAAGALARAYRRAGAELPGHPPAQLGDGRLDAAVRDATLAYGRLAAAARQGNRRAWRRSGREAHRREREVERALRALRTSYERLERRSSQRAVASNSRSASSTAVRAVSGGAAASA
jgi:hypothetical protein